MSDKPSPFETLAADLRSRRHEKQAQEQRLLASRDKVLSSWQPQLIELTDEASRHLVGEDLRFCEYEQVRLNGKPIGWRRKIYGLAKSNFIVVQVNDPDFAYVSLNRESSSKTVELSDEFPKEMFAHAIASILRISLLDRGSSAPTQTKA